MVSNKSQQIRSCQTMSWITTNCRRSRSKTASNDGWTQYNERTIGRKFCQSVVISLLIDIFLKKFVLIKKKKKINNWYLGYDRLFLEKYCPKFLSCLHYRIIDVSTIKELVRIWYKKDESFKKELNHRAIDDIKESIAELKFYRENYFINK